MTREIQVSILEPTRPQLTAKIEALERAMRRMKVRFFWMGWLVGTLGCYFAAALR